MSSFLPAFILCARRHSCPRPACPPTPSPDGRRLRACVASASRLPGSEFDLGDPVARLRPHAAAHRCFEPGVRQCVRHNRRAWQHFWDEYTRSGSTGFRVVRRKWRPGRRICRRPPYVGGLLGSHGCRVGLPHQPRAVGQHRGQRRRATCSSTSWAGRSCLRVCCGTSPTHARCCSGDLKAEARRG